MFRNRSFRTKLALAIAPPLLVLVAVVATVVRPRLDDATSAAHELDMATYADLNMQLRDELQVERDLTIQGIVSRPGTRIDLSTTRQVTDTRRAAVQAAADALRPETQAERDGAAAASQAVASLLVLRDQIDTGTVGPFQIFEGYELLIDGLAEPSRAILRNANTSQLQRYATANLAYLEYKNAIARTNSFLGLRVESGTITQTDLLRAGSDLAVAEQYRKQFETSASPEAVALHRAVASGAEFATATELRERIELSGARNTTPDVSPSAWWQAASRQLASLDEVEDRTFGELRNQAAAAEDEARRDTTVYLAALGIGVLLAALAALALARSISARLAQVTNDARVIASDRLPEVLDALRNPTPEVLAQALPQVTSDSTDEIGSLADSFNTVLRTAVETSINHAHRRSETLTNILVNLGRRNQALIDRQLELVDELESSQRDPDVLRGLFQLDHMITSLRRNAENLLVLASDSQGRAWSAPVPMVDVVRGAIAEVEDMSRIALELDMADTPMISGRHAVDLSHLVAELVDNALAFSPPSSSVQLRAERSALHYRVWVLDNGVGMTEPELAEANLRVANPPDVDDLSADRIGFQVVGRLARRLGVAVRLQPNPGGGVAASITVPAALLDTETSLLGTLPPVDLTGPSGVVAAAGSSWVSTTAVAPAALAAPTRSSDAADPVPATGEVITPSETAPFEMVPFETTPLAAAPFESAPFETAPFEMVPFETTPLAATPYETAPFETATFEMVPFATESSADSPADAAPSWTPVDASPFAVEATSADVPTPSNAAPSTAAPADHAAAPLPTTPLRRSWLDEDLNPEPARAERERTVDGPGFGQFSAPDSPAPLTTSSGLQRRVPGQAFVGDAKAQEFDSGQFRRLPMPGDRPNHVDDLGLAQHRLDALSGLQAGAGRARDEFPDDEQ
jgi:signal transduction histidine kinase